MHNNSYRLCVCVRALPFTFPVAKNNKGKRNEIGVSGGEMKSQSQSKHRISPIPNVLYARNVHILFSFSLSFEKNQWNRNTRALAVWTLENNWHDTNQMINCLVFQSEPSQLYASNAMQWSTLQVIILTLFEWRTMNKMTLINKVVICSIAYR